ncbi:MAG: tetratricopeptide repeat protein [Caldilineaceae bacterium]
MSDGGAVGAANLLDWALLQRVGGQRYVLHELLRQYAEEQLQQTPALAEETAQRHSSYFLDLMAREEAKLYGPALPQVQAQLRQSMDNIRQAWRWAASHGQVESLARSASGLSQLLSVAGYWQEGESLLSAVVGGGQAIEAAKAVACGAEEIRPFSCWLAVQHARFLLALGKLDRAQEVLPAALAGLDGSWRAHALTLQVDLLRMRGEYDDGLASSEEALAIFRRLKDRNGEAQALNRIGQIFWLRADYAQALDYQQQALRLEQAMDHPRGVAQCLSSIGLIHYKQSQYEEALTSHAQALTVARALGNRGDVARHLSTIGVVHIDRGEHAQASAYYEEALSIDRELGNRLGVAIRQTNLGMIYWNGGEFERGLAATEEAARFWWRLVIAAVRRLRWATWA